MVVTDAAKHFCHQLSVAPNVPVYSNADEWTNWKKLSDPVMHIEVTRSCLALPSISFVHPLLDHRPGGCCCWTQLRKWADVLVIAPLSANTLGKIANGLSDNLLVLAAALLAFLSLLDCPVPK